MSKKKTRRARGRLHPVKRGNVWWCCGTIKGQSYRESLETASEEHAYYLTSKREKEILDGAVYGEAIVVTFAELVERYFADKGKEGVGSYRRHLIALVKAFGAMRAKDLTAEVVAKYVAKNHADCAGSSKNAKVINPLRTVYRHGCELGMCAAPTFKRYEEANVQVVGAPQEWIDKFLCEAPRLQTRLFVAVITTAGLRAINARRLQWSRINWDEGSYTFTADEMKNDKGHTAHFPDFVMQMLRELSENKPHETHVFGNYARTDNANKEIIRDARRIGLTKYTSHQIGRHAFAERMLNLGYTLKQVADMAGWSDYSVLNDRYGHLEKSRLASIMKDVGAAMRRGTMKVVKGGKG